MVCAKIASASPDATQSGRRSSSDPTVGELEPEKLERSVPNCLKETQQENAL